MTLSLLSEQELDYLEHCCLLDKNNLIKQMRENPNTFHSTEYRAQKLETVKGLYCKVLAEKMDRAKRITAEAITND